jgi:mRNA-degrading endonuclease HigB of HigAB toxin-antitoxin module
VSDAQLIDLLRSSDLAKLFLMMGNFEGGGDMHIVTNVVGKEMYTTTHVVDKEIPVAAYVVGKDMPTVVDVVGKEMDVIAIVAYKELLVDDDMHVNMDKRPEWREVPEYDQTTARSQISQEEEKEHFMIAGCDPDGDEPIGANKE